MNAPQDHPVEDHKTPSEDYSPEEVVEIQVEALASNDDPYKDAGIEIAYNFASPRNRQSTGPIDSFKKLVKNRKYSPLINHDKSASAPLERKDERGTLKAVQEITLEKNGEESAYRFMLSKQTDGKWADCWMTDAVRRIR